MSRILNLYDEELPLLKGKIGSIDMQEGCIEHCVICGADAPDYKGSMDWNMFEKLCDGIAEIRKTRKVNLLEKKVSPFYQSNPPHYRSGDKTLFDIVTKLERTLDVSTYITVAGWKPGDNYMQHAMEQIVEHSRRGLFHKTLQMLTGRYGDSLSTEIGFSVKTAGAIARADYLKFLKSLLGSTDVETVIKNMGKIKDCTNDFLEQSRYAYQLTENMKTLSHSNVTFEVQYLERPERLPLEYRVFEYLFSRDLVESLYDYCKKKSHTNHDIIYSTQFRAFGGIGRTHTLLEVDLPYVYRKRESYVERGCNPECRLDDDLLYTVFIKHDSSITIYYGENNELRPTYLPREFFLARSQFYNGKDKEKSREYAMLANLQGRNLLR